jgi:protein-L-isoaspartate(D-aspartate) O-methyltransferase
MPPFDFAAQRQTMVDSQVRVSDVTDLNIQTAMRTVPREVFCPPAQSYLAYADAEVEYAPGLWLLRPRDVGKLLQAVRPRAGEAALAIAAPYAAAVMQTLGLSVIMADAGDTTAAQADQYDVIVCEGAVSQVPAAWIAALAPGGRLAVVVRDGPIGSVRLYLRGPDGVGWRAVFDSTPPILPGFEAKAGFVF